MRKHFFLIILILIIPVLYSQEIKAENYYGFIMPSTKFTMIEFRGKSFDSIDLTENDISLAETYLSDFMKKNNKLIYSKLTKYTRQYLGLTSQGRKIVYINLYIPNKPVSKITATKAWYQVLDGGDNFFSLYIDIDTGFCFNIYINGES